MTIATQRLTVALKKIGIQLLCLMLIFSIPSYSCEQLNNADTPVLIFPKNYNSQDPEQGYMFQLIKLILKKSSQKFGPCKAQLLDHNVPTKRTEYYIQNNHFIHVAPLTVSHERDIKMLPIPIPLSKGLMGYRLLMIQNKNTDKFSKVQTLADLSTYLAGQGTDWSDIKILKSNNLPVLTANNIKTLIDMLAYKRFDYFPRSALEITTEIKTYQNKPVMIEPSIVLRYPSMLAFYVNKNNSELAKRLEYGLKVAFADDSFNKFFNSHPSSAQALLNLDLKNRKILDMCNPILPDWVPINQSEYWLEPWSEKTLNNGCAPK